jgi:hypothetical protein
MNRSWHFNGLQRKAKTLKFSTFTGSGQDVLADHDRAMYPNRPEIRVIRVSLIRDGL